MDTDPAEIRAERRRAGAWARALKRGDETLDQDEAGSTAAERLILVDALMLDALKWSGKTDGSLPRLRRSVARVQRRRG